MLAPSRDNGVRKVKDDAGFPGGLLPLVGRSFKFLLRFDPLRGFYVDREGADRPDGDDPLNVAYAVSDDELQNIPRAGATVVISNHPFGGIEGLVLASVLRRVRPDVRVVADWVLARVAELDETFVRDPLDKKGARVRAECLSWLRQGGMLVVFPASEVSQIDLMRRMIADLPWRTGLAGFLRESGAAVLPVYFEGCNGALVQILGIVHSRLGGAVLSHDLLTRRRKEVPVCIGSAIPARKVQGFASDADLTGYLRLRTYILGSRKSGTTAAAGRAKGGKAPALLEPVAEPEDAERVAAEAARLGPADVLAETGEFIAYLAEAERIPCLLQEIGRLREVTFRTVGEGTGRARDLDRFDVYYSHLFVWNREKREVAGAYRLGFTDEILDRFGESGLYTSTLFRFKPGMLDRIRPAIELGRSFVRDEYQRGYTPLMLLWKGISEVLLRNPRYRYLFGPVSINEQYNSKSRQMMIQFLRENNYVQDLAKLVSGRTPMKRRAIKGWDPRKHLVADIDDLSSVISDIESDGKGVPILLRQYLKLGGQLLGCNIDPEFSNVLDALILLDLTRAERKVLYRYMDKDRAEAYLAYHLNEAAAAGQR